MAFVFPPPLPSFSPSSLLASHVCERHRSAVGRSAGASPRLASRHPSPRPCPTRLAWLAHTSPSTLATSFILARHGPSVSEKMPWRTHCKSRLPFLAFGSAGQAQPGVGGAGVLGGFLSFSCVRGIPSAREMGNHKKFFPLHYMHMPTTRRSYLLLERRAMSLHNRMPLLHNHLHFQHSTTGASKA